MKDSRCICPDDLSDHLGYCPAVVPAHVGFRKVVIAKDGFMSLNFKAYERLIELLGDDPVAEKLREVRRITDKLDAEAKAKLQIEHPETDWEEHFTTYSEGYILSNDLPRDHPALITLAEEMPDSSLVSRYSPAHLKIVEIPARIQWYVSEYNAGIGEYVVEAHQAWE